MIYVTERMFKENPGMYLELAQHGQNVYIAMNDGEELKLCSYKN